LRESLPKSSGDRATEASLRELHGPRILHLTTHGFFLNDQEMAVAALKPVGFGAETFSLPVGENPLLRSGGRPNETPGLGSNVHSCDLAEDG
jgi:hypothetical protein